MKSRPANNNSFYLITLLIWITLFSCQTNHESQVNTFKRESRFVLEKHSEKILELLNNPKLQDYFEQSIIRKFDSLNLSEEDRKLHINAFWKRERIKIDSVHGVMSNIVMMKAKTERKSGEHQSKTDGRTFIDRTMDSLYEHYQVHPIMISYYKGLSRNDDLSAYLKDVVLPEIIQLKKENSITADEYEQFRKEVDPQYSRYLTIEN